MLGVSQLIRHLVARATWRGAAETLVLYLPMFAVWFYTSWAATLYSLNHPRARRMMLAVMVAGLFLNASLTRAFADAGWVFVVSLLVIQVGRTAWMLTTGLDARNHDHFRRTLVWIVATGPLWIAGAALAAHVRVVLWGIAAVVDLTGTWLAHPLLHRRLRSERLQFGGEHLMERCRLFLLIALGETVVTPGAALASAPIRAISLLSGALAIAGTLCLWWLYFARAHLTTVAALAAVTGAALPAPAIVTAVAVVIVLSALVAVEHLKSSDQSRRGRRAGLSSRRRGR